MSLYKKNFHMINFIKKSVAILLVYILSSNGIYQVVALLVMQTGHIVLVAIARPYKTIYLNITKLLIESTYLFILINVLLSEILWQRKMLNKTILKKEDYLTFFMRGKCQMIGIIIYDSLFMALCGVKVFLSTSSFIKTMVDKRRQ